MYLQLLWMFDIDESSGDWFNTCSMVRCKQVSVNIPGLTQGSPRVMVYRPLGAPLKSSSFSENRESQRWIQLDVCEMQVRCTGVTSSDNWTITSMVFKMMPGPVASYHQSVVGNSYRRRSSNNGYGPTLIGQRCAWASWVCVSTSLNLRQTEQTF